MKSCLSGNARFSFSSHPTLACTCVLVMNVPMNVDKNLMANSMHRIDFTRFIILAVMRTAAGSIIASKALGFFCCEVQT